MFHVPTYIYVQVYFIYLECSVELYLFCMCFILKSFTIYLPTDIFFLFFFIISMTPGIQKTYKMLRWKKDIVIACLNICMGKFDFCNVCSNKRIKVHTLCKICQRVEMCWNTVRNTCDSQPYNSQEYSRVCVWDVRLNLCKIDYL